MARRGWVLLAGVLVIALAAALVVVISTRRQADRQAAATDPPTTTSTGTAPASTAPATTASTSSSSTSPARTSRSTPTPAPTTSAPPTPTRPSTPVPSAAAPTPTPTSSAPVGTYPQWLPFHNTMKVGCVKSNCENNYHGYWAIDFETLDNKPGAPVYAAGAGRVRIASQGSGNCGGPGTVENALIVDHGSGVESVYVHLHDFAVAPGTWVTPDTVIGHVGSSGYTDPCPDYHLHYEVRINGASVNPGALKACHGTALVTYPYAIGYADWNAIPPQEYAGGKLDPKGRTLYSTGDSCGG